MTKTDQPFNAAFENRWRHLNKHLIAFCEKRDTFAPNRFGEWVPVRFAWDGGEKRVYALVEGMWANASAADGRGLFRWDDASNLDEAKERLLRLFEEWPNTFRYGAWTQYDLTVEFCLDCWDAGEGNPAGFWANA